MDWRAYLDTGSSTARATVRDEKSGKLPAKLREDRGSRATTACEFPTTLGDGTAVCNRHNRQCASPARRCTHALVSVPAEADR